MKSSDSDRWRLVALMASIFFMVDGHFFKTAGSPSTAGHQPKINHDRSHYHLDTTHLPAPCCVAIHGETKKRD
jgi:hypothetical protein